MAPAAAQGAGDRPAGALAQPGVERGERLVEQDHRRLRREGPGERDALLLAAGELVRAAVARAAAVSPTSSSSSSTRGARAPGRPRQAEGDVRRDVEVREQRALLRHVADPAALRAARTARRRPNTAWSPSRIVPASGSVEPGDEPQQGRLAAAGRPEDGGQLAPAGTSRSTPSQHPVGARRRRALVTTTARACRAVMIELRRIARRIAPSPGEQERGRQRDQDHQRGVRRGRAVGDARRCGSRTGSPGSGCRSARAAAWRSAR